MTANEDKPLRQLSFIHSFILSLFLSFLIVLFYLVASRGFYLWIYRQLVGLLGRVIGPTQGLYLHRTTQHREMQTHIHALSRIRTCDLNIRATEDSTCLRPLGYWDRPRLRYEPNLVTACNLLRIGLKDFKTEQNILPRVIRTWIKLLYKQF
jgi:hypothetical protein